MKSWLERQQRFSNSDQASEDLSFRLRLPDASLVTSTGAAPAVYVSNDEPKREDRRAYIAYGVPDVDIQMWAEPRPVKPDYRAMAEQMQEDKQAGRLKADTAPFTIEVKGLDGIATQPGYNLIGSDEQSRPGLVQWWDDGVQYTIHGTWGRGGTQVGQLLAIADSMY